MDHPPSDKRVKRSLAQSLTQPPDVCSLVGKYDRTNEPHRSIQSYNNPNMPPTHGNWIAAVAAFAVSPDESGKGLVHRCSKQVVRHVHEPHRYIICHLFIFLLPIRAAFSSQEKNRNSLVIGGGSGRGGGSKGGGGGNNVGSAGQSPYPLQAFCNSSNSLSWNSFFLNIKKLYKIHNSETIRLRALLVFTRRCKIIWNIYPVNFSWNPYKTDQPDRP